MDEGAREEGGTTEVLVEGWNDSAVVGGTSRGNKGKLFGDHWRRDTILLSSLWVQAKVRVATVTVLLLYLSSSPFPRRRGEYM
mmetsp:Transcript_31174/g.33494  ORF Transcript_31174/g.33494 Transcript_31174/m.33494 type:complete len:83 (-) Transcript_31174:392-640(-)